ncbi:hypothetical protein [Corallococcus exercitus]|uniref:HD domain-containing protein n=1 Tax=Corallococcus exercitus TaxID=2316736 RepID=UPI0035D529F1
MRFTFEQALRRKCEQNPDLSLLLSQWEYDRRLVSDALQTILRYFPHYSRHDASHSNTILVQVARMLGPARIEALSATDLWLLLEAAYQHDIGMVVTDEQVRNWWNTPGFKDFVSQLRDSPDAELRQASTLFDGRAPPDGLARDWPVEVSRILTLTIAEYARRQHASNAAQIIMDPVRTIGLQSPRTHLIPARLFRLLGKICAHHGRSFEDTMLLPFEEAGLGTDDAHPRFVACMLRLGDLLDLDNGRFCPVMSRSFGTLPASSLAHYEKHASINHFQVSPTRIEVETECASYEAYEVTDQWLEWLRGELKNQMAQWSEVAPSRDFGALPSLGKVQAHIKGYLTLEPGRRPRFEVDREQILTLVRGANIYANHFSCIRELLQNAVDATILRVWADRWSSKSSEELSKLTPASLREVLKEFPIRVGFERVPSDEASQTGRWRVFIEDKGTGISLNDVRYIQRIGASSKNPDRQRMIREMPEWMRPSGIFGIGLQSAFLFTDKVMLRSRHHATQEAIEVILQNGQGNGMDGLSIRRLEGAEARIPVGTTVEFHLALARIPKSRGFIASTHFSEARKAFDPVTGLDFPHEIEFTKAIIRNFSEACACPITIQGIPPQAPPTENLFDKADFDPETNLELTLEVTTRDDTHARLYYRGAPLNTISHRSSHQFLNIHCNIHDGRASDFLLINREQLTDEGEQAIQKSLEKTIKKVLPRHISELRRKQPESPEIKAASLSAKLLNLDAHIARKEWLGYQLIVRDGKEMSLDELLSKERVDLIHPDGYSSGSPTLVFRRGESQVEIQMGGDYWWLNYLLPESFEHHGYHAYGQRNIGIYIFSRYRKDSGVSKEGMRSLMQNLHSRAAFFGASYRLSIPCPDEYQTLQYIPGERDELFGRLAPWYRPRMVCPFVSRDRQVTVPSPHKLVQWTAQNAAGERKSEAEIARALWGFIRETDELMAEEWKERKAYDLQRVRFELSRWLD